MKKVGIYIHIPFCRAKCYYCDFISYVNKDHLIIEYIDRLEKEMALYTEAMEDYKITTIFIGGGTPSILEGRQINRIINCLYKHFKVDNKIEISIEANPGILDRQKLMDYLNSGVNRLSIGLQACQNHLLKQIGRIHKYEDFINNLRDARRAGFSNINVDLIFALPNQTLQDWRACLRNVSQLEIPHISTYSLIVEEGTLFQRWLETGKIKRVDEDIELAMYEEGISFLEGKNYNHYEISNFARKGFKCQHNINYWKNGEYLGLGLGAHSHMGKSRFNNYTGMSKYLELVDKGKKPISDKINLSYNDQVSETMFMGLRMMEGISVDDFQNSFGKSPWEIYGCRLEKLKNKKMLQYNKNFIRLTKKGIRLGNQVFQEMLLD